MEVNNDLVPIAALNKFLREETSKKEKKIYNFLCQLNNISEIGFWNERDRLKHYQDLIVNPNKLSSKGSLVDLIKQISVKVSLQTNIISCYTYFFNRTVKKVQEKVHFIQKSFEDQKEIDEINAYCRENAIFSLKILEKEEQENIVSSDLKSVNFHFNITKEKERYFRVISKLKSEGIINNSETFLTLMGIRENLKNNDSNILWNGSGKSMVTFFLLLLDKKAIHSSDRLIINSVLPNYFLYLKKDEFRPITRANVQKALNRCTDSYNSEKRPDPLITFLEEIIDTEFKNEV